MSFKELVNEYNSSIGSIIILRAHWETDKNNTIEGWLICHKLSKHFKEGNLRDMASYLAMWYQEELGPLPDPAKEMARKAGLKRVGNNVGYPHEDGTHHYF